MIGSEIAEQGWLDPATVFVGIRRQLGAHAKEGALAGLVDDWTNVRLRIRRIADTQRLHRRAQPVDEGVVDRVHAKLMIQLS